MSASLATIAAGGVTGFAAILFAQAALHKVADFTAFTGFVQDYRLIPEQLIRPVSALITGAEIVTTLALLVPGLRAIGLLAAAGLLLCYGTAMALALSRGQSQIECGCGGAAQPISTALIARNALIAVAALAATTASAAPLGVGGAVAAITAALLGFAFYLTANQILSNAAQLARLSQGGRS